MATRDLHAELVRPVRLAFADAFHLGRVQRVDLEPPLAAFCASTRRQLNDKGYAKTALSAASPSILRKMSRITRPR